MGFPSLSSSLFVSLLTRLTLRLSPRKYSHSFIYHQQQGNADISTPLVDHKEVDLWLLRKEVTQAGGFNEVRLLRPPSISASPTRTDQSLVLPASFHSTRLQEGRCGPKSPKSSDTLKPSLNRSRSSTPPSSSPSTNSPFELAQATQLLLSQPTNHLPEEGCDPTTQQLDPQPLSERPTPLPTSPHPPDRLPPTHPTTPTPSLQDRERVGAASRLLLRLGEVRRTRRIPAGSRGR